MVICALTKKPYALDIVMVCPANSSSSLSSPNSIVISDIFSLDSSSSSRGFIFVSHSLNYFPMCSISEWSLLPQSLLPQSLLPQSLQKNHCRYLRLPDEY